MSIQTITFTTHLKSDPERDFEITVSYEYYYGHGLGSDDPSEIDIIKAENENGVALTDAQIEEIRTTAEFEIVTELKADREEAQYDNWKERNL